MKNFTARVSFLETDYISSVKKQSIFVRAKNYPFFSKFLTNFFSKIIGMDEGGVIFVSTSNHQGERRMLEDLRVSKYIESYFEGPLFSDYPKLYMIGIEYGSTQNIGSTFRAWGYTRLNEDRCVAYSKVIGEFFERNATLYNESQEKNKDLKIKKMDMSTLFPLLPHYTSKQVKNNHALVSLPLDLKSVRAIKVNSLTKNSKEYLPLSCFYWGGVRKIDEKIIAHETSNGGGGGLTKDKAILSAVYELIERDHLLLYWFSGVNPSIISNETIQGEFGRFVANVENEYGLEVYFLDIQYDINIKVSACVLIDPVLNIISMGAKASSSAVETVRGSLLEALAVMFNLRDKNISLQEVDLKRILKEKSFNKDITGSNRLMMYCSVYGIELIRKSFLQGEKMTYQEYESNLRTFISTANEREFIVSEFVRLTKEKGGVYHLYVNFPKSYLTKKYDYNVAKAFVPALIPLHLTENLAAPVSPRLYEFAKIKGVKVLSEDDIVTLPHFFP